MPPRKKESGYEEGTWNGLPNFTCNDCPFSTLKKELIVEHVKFHAGAVAASTTETGLPTDENKGGES